MRWGSGLRDNVAALEFCVWTERRERREEDDVGPRDDEEVESCVAEYESAEDETDHVWRDLWREE